MRIAARLLAIAGCLVAPPALPAQQGALSTPALQPPAAPRPLCPEYAGPEPEEWRREKREAFRPQFVISTPQGEELARSVDALVQEAWAGEVIQPRVLLNDLVRSMAVDVGGMLGDGLQPRAERVTDLQLARVEHYRRSLRALNRGTLSGSDLLRGLRPLSLRLLLACPATLRDRRVRVHGTVHFARSPLPPHEVTGFTLEDRGLRVPLVWAGTGAVAEIDPPFFEGATAATSWWNVSVSQVNGAPAVLLHDFLGRRRRGGDEPAQDP
jgi:hypothetical protein